MKRILLVEDDEDLKEGLAFTLSTEGYEIETAGTCRETEEKICSTGYDAVILDCNLPDGNGFDLLKALHRYSEVQILMLTARDTELDEVKALELGVDDFMTKPFSVAVLKARLKKLLYKKEEGQFLFSNKIRLDKTRCRVWRGEEEISLSKSEYKLLLYFMENKNHILSKEQILDYIWDREGRFVDENTISVNVRRLRQKVEEDASSPKFIKTIHGFGYLWKELQE